MAAPPVAMGQAKDAREPRKGSPSAAAAKRVDAQKVVRAEELKVEGRVQKPQAMFLMPRANLSVRDLERSEPFLPKVAEALERAPF
jgi:hypothetical protein